MDEDVALAKASGVDKVICDGKVLAEVLLWIIRGHHAQVVFVWKQSTRRVVNGKDVRYFVFVELRQILAVAIVAHIQSRQNLRK